jgi:hypothetical protein
MAGLLVMGMYWEQIHAMKLAFEAKGLHVVSNGGPASILCTFPNANQNNQGYLFLYVPYSTLNLRTDLC